MAVWAFHKRFDASLRIRKEFDLGSIGPDPYELLTIPYWSNPNIQAQQDLFPLVRHSADSKSIDQRPLDEIVAEYTTQLVSRHPDASRKGNPAFLRLKLPWSEFQPLLVLLAKAGINGSTVFLGYKGVVDAVKEKL